MITVKSFSRSFLWWNPHVSIVIVADLASCERGKVSAPLGHESSFSKCSFRKTRRRSFDSVSLDLNIRKSVQWVCSRFGIKWSLSQSLSKQTCPSLQRASSTLWKKLILVSLDRTDPSDRIRIGSEQEPEINLSCSEQGNKGKEPEPRKAVDMFRFHFK